MKRSDLIRHLEANGCVLVREGAKHTVYHNLGAQRTSTVLRHREVKNPTAVRICKQLSISLDWLDWNDGVRVETVALGRPG